jgi:hypothetical protein
MRCRKQVRDSAGTDAGFGVESAPSVEGALRAVRGRARRSGDGQPRADIPLAGRKFRCRAHFLRRRARLTTPFAGVRARSRRIEGAARRARHALSLVVSARASVQLSCCDASFARSAAVQPNRRNRRPLSNERPLVVERSIGSNGIHSIRHPAKAGSMLVDSRFRGNDDEGASGSIDALATHGRADVPLRTRARTHKKSSSINAKYDAFDRGLDGASSPATKIGRSRPRLRK